MADQWWVVETPDVHLGTVTPSIVQAATRTEAEQKGNGAVVAGPFQTQQEAQQALNGISSQPGSDIAAKGGPTFHIPNPLHGIDEVAGAVTGFFGVLTDVTLWRSLGWLLLGVALIILGLYLWLKKQDIIPDAVPVPVPV
jgi:hypothetical protein